MGRFVPFVAVAAANSINLPLMRQRELKYGIPITNKEGDRLGLSKVGGAWGGWGRGQLF